MGKRITLAALAALALGPPLAAPARAQVGPDAPVYIFDPADPDRYGYDRPRRPPPPPPDDDYGPPRRPPPPPDDDYGPRRRRPPPPPPDEIYDRRRYRDEYEDRRPWRGGSVCVTARGTCLTRPAPFNAPCGCEIPGFGFKRGQIGE